MEVNFSHFLNVASGIQSRIQIPSGPFAMPTNRIFLRSYLDYNRNLKLFPQKMGVEFNPALEFKFSS